MNNQQGGVFKMSTTSALQINQIVRQSTLILISIIMTKCHVSTELIGLYETMMFLTYTVSFFWLNAFLQSILTHYASTSAEKKSAYSFNMFLIFNGLSIVIFLILFLFPQQSLHFFSGKNDTPISGVFAIYVFFFLPPFMLESIWAVEERPLSILGFSIFSNLLFLVSMIVFSIQKETSYSFIELMSISAFFRYLILIIHVLKRGNYQFSKEIIRDFGKITSPLMGYAFVGGFTIAFSNWIIGWYYKGDFASFAIYRFGAREFPIILAMSAGLSSGLIPILIKNKVNNALNTEGLSVIKAKTLRLWHILFPMSIALMLSSKYVFGFVFNQEMVKAAPIFNVFLLLLPSRALFPQTIMMAYQETKIMFRISVVESISIVVMGFLFIHFFGMIGVAWAMVLGFLIEKIMMIFYLRKKFNIDLKDYTHLNYFLFYTFALLISFFISKLF
jgi:O-antigen/teichoic acid export membrane protein